MSSSILHSRRALWLLWSPKHKAGSSPHSRTPQASEGCQGADIPKTGSDAHLPDASGQKNEALYIVSAEACDPKCLQAVGRHEGSIPTNLGSFILRPYRQVEDPEKPIKGRQRLRKPDTFRASRRAEGHTECVEMAADTGARNVSSQGRGFQAGLAWGLSLGEAEGVGKKETERGIPGDLKVKNFSLKREKSLFQSAEVLEEERKRT